MVAGHGVGHDRRVRVAEVRHRVDVVDRRREIEGLAHGRTVAWAILRMPGADTYDPRTMVWPPTVTIRARAPPMPRRSRAAVARCASIRIERRRYLRADPAPAPTSRRLRRPPSASPAAAAAPSSIATRRTSGACTSPPSMARLGRRLRRPSPPGRADLAPGSTSRTTTRRPRALSSWAPLTTEEIIGAAYHPDQRRRRPARRDLPGHRPARAGQGRGPRLSAPAIPWPAGPRSSSVRTRRASRAP